MIYRKTQNVFIKFNKKRTKIDKKNIPIREIGEILPKTKWEIEKKVIVRKSYIQKLQILINIIN